MVKDAIHSSRCLSNGIHDESAKGEWALIVPFERIREQIVAVLTAWGMPPDLVSTTAGVMTDTDLAGIDSHGISMLTQYDEMRSKGIINFQARPEVIRENPATALIDAGAGLGHPAAVMGMNLAIQKARNLGVGLVSVFNSHHFGAAGYYAVLAAKEVLLGFVTSSTRTVAVVPTRASIPVLGTNPIAFAAPGRRNRPFVLDMSTSTVAANKVKVYDLNNQALPPGWVLNEKGEPVQDAALAMDYIFRRNVGGLTPLGGTPEMGSHKGYGLSVMVQILSATLAGASFSAMHQRTRKPQEPDNIGHFLMAIDPQAFRPAGAFEDDLDALIDELHGIAPSDPAMPVLVAGDPEASAREERLQDGIPVPPALAEKIRLICRRCGARFLLS
jgi:LDH2 family malate/lactate/ureidoglycolate dehydrogenase